HRFIILWGSRHAEWRKLAKKTRRKRIRQKFARLRDEEKAEECIRIANSPTHQCYLAEQAIREEILAEENAKKSKDRELEWLRVEVEAQRQFQELQKKLAQAREERTKQNEQIKAEWEKEQLRQKEAREKEEQEHEEQLRQQELLNQKVEDFLELGGDTPEHLKTILETNPNRTICPFFQKTSTCRFFDVCSRNHIRPGISRIILIPNFFSHYSLEKGEEHGSDSGLEFESHETYKQFREFFNDVVPELEQYGKIKFFFTCCNHETHLRGNVFIEFAYTRAALKCYRGLNGRWYGGKQLSVQFARVNNWKSAICGKGEPSFCYIEYLTKSLFQNNCMKGTSCIVLLTHFILGLFNSQRCPKGNSCNFLHVFRNPKNSYGYEEQRHWNSDHGKSKVHSTSHSWRWSESPNQTSLQKSEWESDEESNYKLKYNHRSHRRRSRSRDIGNGLSKRSVSPTHKTSKSSRSRKSERKKRSHPKSSH
ncbi:unnamed protein product, partial [Phaedon cochleariae]